MSCPRPNVTLCIVRGCDFGPVGITCYDSPDEETRQPVDLTNWTVEAQIRRGPAGDLLLDLLPEITEPETDGKIEFARLTPAQTASLPRGESRWDVILIDPTGYRLPPITGGPANITDPITQE